MLCHGSGFVEPLHPVDGHQAGHDLHQLGEGEGGEWGLLEGVAQLLEGPDGLQGVVVEGHGGGRRVAVGAGAWIGAARCAVLG